MKTILLWKINTPAPSCHPTTVIPFSETDQASSGTQLRVSWRGNSLKTATKRDLSMLDNVVVVALCLWVETLERLWKLLHKHWNDPSLALGRWCHQHDQLGGCILFHMQANGVGRKEYAKCGMVFHHTTTHPLRNYHKSTTFGGESRILHSPTCGYLLHGTFQAPACELQMQPSHCHTVISHSTNSSQPIEQRHC